MRKPLMLLITASLLLTACGWRDARLNPRNWFGKSRAVTVGSADQANPLIPERSAISRKRETKDTSVSIATLTELRINPTPSGAIILVTGVSARQGAYSAELVADDANQDDTSDTLSYSFRVTYPKSPTPVGTAHTRTIHVAQSVTHHDLRNIRLIRVSGASGAIESRRR